MRWIYISPHLDDAVLSAGGLIHDQTRAGMDVEIWTILCGFPPTKELSPFAQVLHDQWGISEGSAAEMISTRRAEDVKAAGIVGAKTVHFDFLDCIYRHGKNGEWLYSNVFVPLHEDEEDLPSQIAESISVRLKPTDQLICQLGVGSHVDHVLVRRAVELLQHPILYDVDIPYLFNSPEELAPKTAEMQANTHRITDSGLRSWQEAISAYESQFSGLFDSSQAMRMQIEQYWSKYIGICLWNSA
jgi:LmbE family N-acetylglucosaminyl deacetylase